MYQDILNTYGDVYAAMQRLSALYEQSRGPLEKAIRIDMRTGAAKVNRAGLQRAFELVSAPMPPDELERMAAGFELGFLVSNDKVVAPASMLLDPALTAQVDVNTWRTLGVDPGASTDAVIAQIQTLYPPVSKAVLSRKVIDRLVAEVAREQARVSSYELYLGLPAGALCANVHPNGGPADPPIKGGATPVHPSAYPPHTDSYPWDEYVHAAECLFNASYTWRWYGIEVCMDRACADALQDILVGGNWESFLIAFQQLTTKVFQAIVGGGWVGAVIAAAEFYWGAMIAGNKGAGGVCLCVPGPWTLGWLGPGWGVGK